MFGQILNYYLPKYLQINDYGKQQSAFSYRVRTIFDFVCVRVCVCGIPKNTTHSTVNIYLDYNF